MKYLTALGSAYKFNLWGDEREGRLGTKSSLCAKLECHRHGFTPPKRYKLEEAVAECECHHSLISLLYDSLQNVGYSKCLAQKGVWCVTMVMKGSVSARYFSSVYSELTLGIQIK